MKHFHLGIVFELSLQDLNQISTLISTSRLGWPTKFVDTVFPSKEPKTAPLSVA